MTTTDKPITVLDDLVRIERKYGLSLPYAIKVDLLELVSRERRTAIDAFCEHLKRVMHEQRG